MSKLLTRKSVFKRTFAYLAVLMIAFSSLFFKQFSLEANTQTTFQRPPFSIGIGQTYNDEGTVVLTGFVDPRNLKVTTYFEYGLNTNFANKLQILGEITTARDVYGRIPTNFKNQVKFVRFCGKANNGLVRCSNAEIVDFNNLPNLPQEELEKPPIVVDNSNNQNNNQGQTGNSGNDKPINLPPNENTKPSEPVEVLDPALVARTEFLKSIGLVQADPLVDWFTVVTQYVSTYSEEGGMVIEINNKKDTLSPGEYNSYRVAIGNGYTKSIKDATLLVILPEHVSFISADYGVYIPSRHSVIYSLNEIKPTERISYYIHTQANIKEGSEQIPQLAVAEISFVNPNVLKTNSVVSYDVDNFYPNVPEEAISPVENLAEDLVALSFGSNTNSGFMIMMLLILIVFIEAVILINELNVISRKKQFVFNQELQPAYAGFQVSPSVDTKYNYTETKNSNQHLVFGQENIQEEKKDSYYGHLGF